MSTHYANELQELSKYIKDEIEIVENGGKLSSFKREVKPPERELRNRLLNVGLCARQLLREVASTGQVQSDWHLTRGYFIVALRELLEGYDRECRDSKTFEEEKEVILQYFVFFEK